MATVIVLVVPSESGPRARATDMAGLDVSGVELHFTCPHCGGQAPARIEAVRMLPVIDCGCGERFGVDMAAFAAQVTAAETAARAARRRPRA
ncbi:hypothetical protein [Caulobacter vibrioides]|uniref:Uncharacterized protein n=2 Tax=Caulobacter vibrioides TaxID=155892 RepID=Q9A367_CAUVC|nr:hypothetical protein [Caulobacter vibrioides]YP_002518820.1 hypothetical protein CCNA_03447 [Caulobacter vibrioides NA1000]AAK25301.1 hypothetical protein CC_3339 [Caulobacter vibrioides CB15]ACL96912.1 hypothetical protein CCNA_03447 [Caulobacter vibrioides NA1000]ATC30161.1 hypothetical protein CA607_17925 [Caulobacter vibrioides]QXZ51687.1 hypothetical protein KZH45_17670 [Caulobacter vibrioides]